ncbi:DinB family protein [Chloroflexota bacterium]
MAHELCDSLLNNFKTAITLVVEVTGQFDKGEWLKGFNHFQVAAKIAYHIVDTLDYYFRENPEEEYKWGHRLGGAWWELPDEEQPDQEAVLDYLKEIEERIVKHISSLDDADLVEPYDNDKQFGSTRLGHYIYALRHTMHHHGAYSLLAIYYGHKDGTWA